MDPWDLLIWLGSAGFIACLVPQFVRTVRRKRADDLSVPYLVLVLAASSCTLPYMLHQAEYVLAAAQFVNLVVWGTVFYYRLRPGAWAPESADVA